MRLSRWIPFVAAVAFVSAMVAILANKVSDAHDDAPPESAGACPELADLDPAFTKLSIAELEDKLRDEGVLAPSIAEKRVEGIDAATAAYHPDKRDCMRKVMLVQQVAMDAKHRGQGGSMWYYGRSSTELASIFKTIGLKSAWSTAERERALAYVDSTFVAHVGSPGDAEHYRRLYYGLLIGCEATDGELARVGARRETSCVDVSRAHETPSRPKPRRRGKKAPPASDPLVIPSTLPPLIDPFTQ